MRTRSFALSALVVMALFAMVAVAQAAEKEKPDGTIRLQSKSVAAIVGFSWGSGKLSYKGKTYDLNVDGLTAGSVGVSGAEATGEVYHLKKISDFDGNYTAAVAGGTVGGGGAALVMENQNGVKVELRATTRGVSLTAGVSGVKLSIKK